MPVVLTPDVVGMRPMAELPQSRRVQVDHKRAVGAWTAGEVALDVGNSGDPSQQSRTSTGCCVSGTGSSTQT